MSVNCLIIFDSVTFISGVADFLINDSNNTSKPIKRLMVTMVNSWCDWRRMRRGMDIMILSFSCLVYFSSLWTCFSFKTMSFIHRDKWDDVEVQLLQTPHTLMGKI